MNQILLPRGGPSTERKLVTELAYLATQRSTSLVKCGPRRVRAMACTAHRVDSIGNTRWPGRRALLPALYLLPGIIFHTNNPMVGSRWSRASFANSFHQV